MSLHAGNHGAADRLGAAGLPTGFDVIGTGRDALLLPALSSVSTRREMHGLADDLADALRCVIPDWPGFGGEPRARSDLSPGTMHRFLDVITAGAADAPLVGIAAGHGATYLLACAQRHPSRFSRVVLIAPTWRGPLPTMFGGRRQGLCRRVRGLLELPVLGSLLYRLNVSRPIIGRMMRAHVYAGAVSAGVIAAKRAVARQPGGRFSTAAFVTGALDPLPSRAAFLDCVAAQMPPILLIRPDGAPPRSGAEMDALAATGRVETARVPGALAAHEEFPQAVAHAIRRFL